MKTTLAILGSIGCLLFGHDRSVARIAALEERIATLEKCVCVGAGHHGPFPDAIIVPATVRTNERKDNE